MWRLPCCTWPLHTAGATIMAPPHARAGMALNLQEDLKNGGKDRQLLVYNRTAAKMEPLVAAGADRCISAWECRHHSDQQCACDALISESGDIWLET